jgi:predicted lipoprotein with Yx(FWY)xxD motif
MTIQLTLRTLLAGLALTVGSTQAAPMSTDGGVLTDERGMTLYVFDNDKPGTSNCNGPCAANWPPLMAGAGESASGDYSIITRADGSRQWAYKDRPLYLWVKDAKPGDQTGDGVKGVWHTAQQ